MTEFSTHPADRRLLLVHAHPDDETIVTGATMARYADEGSRVVLVTCTRGEQGEVIGPLARLEGDGPALAAHRERELAAAMAALGVSDHRFLGQDATGADGRPVRYVDSGMVWGPDGLAAAPPDLGPDAFAAVPVDDAATHLARVVREVRPQVLVTYEPGGGYGHPDHVQAHRVAMRAVELAADPRLEVPGRFGDIPWRVAKVYWVVAPRSVHGRAVAELAARGLVTRDPQAPPPSMVVPDEEATCRIDAERYRDLKVTALRAHGTQVVVADDEAAFALSNGVWQPLTGTEYFRLAVGCPAIRSGAVREEDLFARATEVRDPGAKVQAGATTPTGPASRHPWPGGGRLRRRAATALGALAALAVGAVAGLSGVLWHHVTWELAVGRFAFGLVVGVALLAALALTTGLAARRSRLPVLGLLVGWLVPVAAGAWSAPGGDALITADRYGLGYALACVAALLVAGVLVPRRWQARDGATPETAT